MSWIFQRMGKMQTNPKVREMMWHKGLRNKIIRSCSLLQEVKTCQSSLLAASAPVLTLGMPKRRASLSLLMQELRKEKARIAHQNALDKMTRTTRRHWVKSSSPNRKGKK